MKITVKDRIKITVKNQNDVGKVVFGKIAKVEDLRLTNMSDVDISQQQDGYVLVYDQPTNKYSFRAIEIVDGGYF
jgi:hypothetical protein